MALIAIGSAKGAPGTTTSALALASVWPRGVVLADCDPAGGDVTLRLPGDDGRPLDPDRGMVSLGSAARRELVAGTVDEHTQKLLGGLDLLAGLRTGEQTAGMDPLWPVLGGILRDLPGRDVLVDVGRVGPSSPTLALVRAAHLIVLVTRTDVASLFHTRERLDALTRTARAASVDVVRTAVLIVADPSDKRAIASARDVFQRQEARPDAVWSLPLDEKGARLFGGDLVSRPERTALVRGATRIAPSALTLAAALGAGARDGGAA